MPAETMLARVARYVDALAEEHGLAGSVRLSGIHLPDALEVGEHHALRAVVGVTRDFEVLADLRAGRDVDIVLDAHEREMLRAARVAHLDGLVMGAMTARFRSLDAVE